MSTPPERVRVTAPTRRPRPARSARAAEIDQGTDLGAVLVGSLVREQRRLALIVLGCLSLTLGLLPLAFHLFGGLAQARLWGVPLAWLLLAVLAHPLLIGLGWWYVRRAEANERSFTELLADQEP